MNPGRIIAFFLAVATGLRWWWNFARPLSGEESYLALCGFIPSPAYFDGPGGTPLLVASGISLAGAGGFGATFFWPVLAATASVAIYLLTSALLDRRAGAAVAVLLNLLPVFNHAALHASCAMPLTAASLMSLLCAWRAVDSKSVAWWFVAGLCVAFGLLFSYAALFFFPVMGLVLSTSHRWRRQLLSVGFWLAWIPSIAVCVVLLCWNAQHDWVHFIGSTWRSTLTLRWSELGASLTQAGTATTPFVLFVLLFATAFAARRVGSSPRTKFLLIPASAAFLAAAYAALRGLPTVTPGLLAASLTLPLIALLPVRIAGASTRIVLSFVYFTAAVWCAATLTRPATTSLVDQDVGHEVAAIRAELAAHDAKPLFLIAEDAPLAAALALALPDDAPAEPGHPPVYTVESAAARSQFDLWPRYDQFVEAKTEPSPAGLDPFTEQDGANPFIGRSALFITTQLPDDLPQAISAAFGTVEAPREIKAPDGRILRIYLCSDYQTMPL